MASRILEYLPWQKATGDIYYTGTANCVATQLTGSHMCQTRSESISANVGFEVEGFSMGLSVTVTNEESRWETASDTTTCTWKDA
ncbi:hypothetical protein QQX98_011789 [Neonectria punicea]|uniref:Uncharacterized protein n=1 Tax=Neonectria punicea TaxID=979145 RepID=A0ABR1GKP8_9HYPO